MAAADWREQFAAERDNLRAALAWSQTQPAGAAAGLRLAENFGQLSLWLWLHGEGTGEALAWLRTFLDLAPEPNVTRGRALIFGSILARFGGDSAHSLAYAEEASTIFRELGDVGWATLAENQIGLTLAEDGHSARAVERLEHSVALARAGELKLALADALRDLGLGLTSSGDLAGARAAFEESLAIARELDQPRPTARALLHLGNLDRLEGNLARARARFDECGSWVRQSTPADQVEPHRDIDLQISQALLAAAQGDRVTARVALQALLRSHWQRGDRRWSGTLLCALGTLAVLEAKTRPGVRLIAAGAAVNPRFAIILFPSVRLDVAYGLARARTLLAEEAFATAWAQGQTLTLEQAVADALDEDGG
jgi:tetratricopeptide (TPR) repeat protein